MIGVIINVFEDLFTYNRYNYYYQKTIRLFNGI